MRSLVATTAAALAALALAPAAAQEAAPAVDAMTCGEFLALGGAGQMDAMMALRASYNGEAPPVAAEAPPASAGDAGNEGGDADGQEAAAEGSHRLSGMRTACEGVPDVLALDALVAAHADYDE